MHSSGEFAARLAVATAAARSAPATVRSWLEGLAERDVDRKPGVGKLSLLEHVRHLRDMETSVFGPRLRRVLDEDHPRLEPLVVEDHLPDPTRDVEGGGTTADVHAALEEWTRSRESNAALVAATDPDQWTRTAEHPQVGQATFLELVERWARHDVDHLRQIEILALNSRERNLP